MTLFVLGFLMSVVILDLIGPTHDKWGIDADAHSETNRSDSEWVQHEDCRYASESVPFRELAPSSHDEDEKQALADSPNKTIETDQEALPSPHDPSSNERDSNVHDTSSDSRDPKSE